MTNEMTRNEEHDKLYKLELEKSLFAALQHYYTEVRKVDAEAKMYDPTGAQGFVVVAFNNVKDEALLLPEDSEIELTAQDRAVAISSSSIAVMPYVQPNDEGTIGPQETIKHGVQAVATAMLLSNLQANAIFQTMKMAQQVIIKQRSLT